MKLEDIKRITEAATPGPWDDCGSGIDQTVEPWGTVIGLETKGSPWMTYEVLVLSNADAAFIAMARTVLPKLIAELEAARTCIKEVRYGYDCTGHYEMTHAALKKYDKTIAALESDEPRHTEHCTQCGWSGTENDFHACQAFQEPEDDGPA